MTILLIGACGSGKTWVMKQLINDDQWVKAKIGLFRFNLNQRKRIAVMGVYDGTTFEGSDRLSMGLMKDINLLLQSKIKNKLTIVCEGDRFTNSTFIDKLKPIIIKIEDDGELGRKIRNSNQSERHIKSIKTRISNIKETHLVASSSEALGLIKKILNDL
jgi:hypothetical protein